VRNFIATRHETETAAITEAITILEGSAASLQSDVDRTIAALQEEQAKHPPLARSAGRSAVIVSKPAPAASAGTAAPPTLAAARTDGHVIGPSPAALLQLSRTNAALEAKRNEIGKIESQHRQHLADLQARLNAALTIYTNDHPTVVGLRQTVASDSREPPELATLRNEARQLQEQYDAADRAARESALNAENPAMAAIAQLPGPGETKKLPPDGKAEPALRPEVPAPMLAIMPADMQRLTDLVNPASRLLTLQLAQLANLLDRINGARLELATSAAGLKYRYSVTHPAEIPRAPIRPNVASVLIAGVVGGLVLAVFCALALDLVSGLVLEPWQVERQLGVPVIAILTSVPEQAR
jgi:hypothetical protein